MLLAACGAASPPRVRDRLEGFDGVVASTSLAAMEQPEPSRTSEGIKIDYPLLFENAGEREVAVGLGHAVLVALGSERGSSSCAVAGKKLEVLLLQPGERWRVDCQLVVPRKSSALARDLDLHLLIPVRSRRGEAVFAFAYALRVEDAK